MYIYVYIYIYIYSVRAWPYTHIYAAPMSSQCRAIKLYHRRVDTALGGAAAAAGTFEDPSAEAYGQFSKVTSGENMGPAHGSFELLKGFALLGPSASNHELMLGLEPHTLKWCIL